ncbi:MULTISPECIES: GNAT family N-acetyltransferase [unclassified Arthrobacter]|uniref:GNAT family N-acetyltransferase n=1 Tax=unclassified Arthrobacter TaxID=235627 RepID=UPI001D154A79|nr:MULTISPECIES: GNAT family protein [unclassified Arthrobacter]MCC3275420.1 GNAT family N-acetyltransferase [Arthrobacter sp. zg-Y20]MCC9176865.1 GNAT family N-acetyltransferase [Arthrobacter sp. zg-Y750]MDK1315577.1 GNAT family protein [Arthrobacter sp. zg.Y20]WIB05992.1 GNAT family protein [Arthrobacter sp. zg-Y20]
MESSTGIPPWPSTDPQYGNVRLRAFRDEDAPMVMEMARDEYFPTVGSLPANADHEQALEWLERQRQLHDKGSGFSFAITDAETDTVVGQVGLWGWELPHGRTQAGYGIIPAARRRGYAGNALRAVAEFAWSIPEVQRMELYIEPWNAASIRTAESAGFEREGLLRSYMVIAGQRRDLLVFSSLRQP